MLRRFFLFLIIIICSPVANASFWSALANCLADPCNCGYSDKYRYEIYDGKTKRFKKDYLCPPWDKQGGREDNVCLLKQDYPGTFIGVYRNLCAEETKDSTYFAPKIRVRGQQCNFAACWSTNDTLNWDGDCVTLAGGYGAFPLNRMCARIALPEDKIRKLAEDPGYTKYKHLDEHGITQQDEFHKGPDGQQLQFQVPKLCLYRDPAFASVSHGLSLDVMDLDPNHQSMHKTTKMHPIVEAILMFLNFVKKASLSGLIGELFDKIFGGDDKDGQTTFSSVMKDIFKYVGDVIHWVGTLIEVFLKEFGQINREVDDTIYGCVNLEMGPYPPPFCKTTEPFEVPDLQVICTTDINGIVGKSVSTRECHVSTVENNYIRNSVRVAYEDLVPLCKSGEDPNTTDKCIKIRNLEKSNSAKVMHLYSANRDTIPQCGSSNSSDSMCVESMVPYKCSVSSDGCNAGYRIVYGQKFDNKSKLSMPQTYYVDDLPDCGGGASGRCQEIWGINRGEFIDISVTFPQVESNTGADKARSTLEKDNIILADSIGRKADMKASIRRIRGDSMNGKFQQDVKELCVFAGNLLVGCQDRINNSEVKVYECSNPPSSSLTCDPTYFQPQFIAMVKDGKSDYTAAVIKPETVYDNGENTGVNLAGNEMGSFITDDKFTMKPFAGDNAPNAASIFGEYKDNQLPINGSTVNENAIYLQGLEYINDKYHLGGIQTCIEMDQDKRCPTTPEICILAGLLNTEIVSCDAFYKQAESYSSLTQCTTKQKSECKTTSSLTRIDGGTIPIKSCDGGVYCYDYNTKICEISHDTAHRINPDPALGDQLSSNEYYNVVSKVDGKPTTFNNDYNTKSQIVRDKTPKELGLCVAVPQGICPAENDIDKDTGYASWPSVKSGELSHGTCGDGMVPKTSQEDLVRRCIPNPDTKTFNLEPVYTQAAGDSTVKKNYNTNIQCIKKYKTIQYYDDVWNEKKKDIDYNDDYWDKWSDGSWIKWLDNTVKDMRANNITVVQLNGWLTEIMSTEGTVYINHPKYNFYRRVLDYREGKI